MHLRDSGCAHIWCPQDLHTPPSLAIWCSQSADLLGPVVDAPPETLDIWVLRAPEELPGPHNHYNQIMCTYGTLGDHVDVHYLIPGDYGTQDVLLSPQDLL